jgi:Flp pilus assembly pilin Flp
MQAIGRTGRPVRIELHSTRRGSGLACSARGDNEMKNIFHRLWSEDEAQDIAEYAVMLAVILVIVVGTIRLIGSNANNVFSSVASSISQ